MVVVPFKILSIWSVKDLIASAESKPKSFKVIFPSRTIPFIDGLFVREL